MNSGILLHHLDELTEQVVAVVRTGGRLRDDIVRKISAVRGELQLTHVPGNTLRSNFYYLILAWLRLTRCKFLKSSVR